MMTQDETNLKSHLHAAYPLSSPSDDLVQRVTHLAEAATASQARRIRSTQRRRLAFTMTALTASVVLFTFMWPTFVAARTLYRMAGLMDDAQSAHIIKWNVAPNGSRTKSEETWYQTGQWRMQGPKRLQFWSQGVFWHYDPALQKATFEKRASGPAGYSPSGFSIGPLLRDAARSGVLGSRNIHDLGKKTVQGRLVHEVLLTNEPNFSHERILVLADAQTDLPFEMDNQTFGGEWKTVQISELQYNAPLAPALFATKFPQGTQIVDADQEKKDWQQKLGQGIQTKRVGNRTIVIRDLQVNAEGDVFLLFTEGQFPGDVGGDNPELQDDHGTIYQHHWGFQPCESDIKGNYAGGLVVKGERVDGSWWVPVMPQMPWTPRRFTLTFSVNPNVSHTKFTPMQPGKVYMAGKPFTPQTVTFGLDLQKPACAEIPDYAPYLGYPFKEWDLAKGDAEIRAGYAKDTLHDLNHAMEYDRQAIAASDTESQAIGQKVNDAVAWLNLYDVLHDLGRSQEAKDALMHARDEDVGHNNTQQISDAMNAEGMN